MDAHTDMSDEERMKMEPAAGHLMPVGDPDSPQNFSLMKKVYASAAAFFFVFVFVFGATVYSAGITGVTKRFDVSMTVAILGYSLYFWGIAFAPLFTPHLSERFGRLPVYLATFPIYLLFILGASFSKSFPALAVCRFFAGFFGGPTVVLIEGTFADVWSADAVVSYYSVLTLASFIGAAAGPLIGGFIFAWGGWKWTQWMVLILGLGAYLFGIAMPETYPRQLIRRRAKRNGVPHNLPKAESGVTVGEMASVTLLHPVKMIVTEPIVIGLSLYVGFIFAVIFQFFISIPVVLGMTYNFTVQQVGIAFTAAILGVVLAAISSSIIDRLTYPHISTKTHDGKVPEEYRMLPGMAGSFGIAIALFWIGWTASPKISYLSPIFGTALFIWGTASVLISSISYLFDAYPPRGTLSALTAAAVFRLILAGLIPMVIIQMFKALTGAWAVSTFGFIAIALIPIPWVLFYFGSRLRGVSPYCPDYVMPTLLGKGMSRDEDMRSGSSGRA